MKDAKHTHARARAQTRHTRSTAPTRTIARAYARARARAFAPGWPFCSMGGTSHAVSGMSPSAARTMAGRERSLCPSASPFASPSPS